MLRGVQSEEDSLPKGIGDQGGELRDEDKVCLSEEDSLPKGIGD